ncbi:MAG: hypothetical protein D3925_02385 [Candidatus Electrothrix sp. AR5]|nr:hypothetical protein [Candidatus Electrothrix sp. AR5]
MVSADFCILAIPVTQHDAVQHHFKPTCRVLVVMGSPVFQFALLFFFSGEERRSLITDCQSLKNQLCIKMMERGNNSPDFPGNCKRQGKK